MLDKKIVVQVDESAGAVRENLVAFGHEWRESKLPESLRAKGFRSARVRTRGSLLDIRLGPNGRGVAFMLEATVVGHASGSVIEGRVRQAPWQRRYFLVVGVLWPLLAAFVTASDYSLAAIMAPAVWLWCVSFAMMVGIQIAGLSKAAGYYEDLVRHAAHSRAAAA